MPLSVLLNGRLLENHTDYSQFEDTCFIGIKSFVQGSLGSLFWFNYHVNTVKTGLFVAVA
jgi:hypothetical protein